MSERRSGRLAWLVLVALAAVIPTVARVPDARAAVIRLINGDGPSEGFNDPTPIAPVGGNTGTTRGAQRLIAFQRAVDMWSEALDSPVEIRVAATFDPLDCDASSAILGVAGPVAAFSDFAGAPLPNTLYASALADRLAGMDLAPDEDDIEVQLNSSFGTTCAFPAGWYYGLDGAGQIGDSDLLTVVLHEIAHGLGYLSFVDVDTGTRLMDMDDPFSDFLVDDRTGKTFPQMTNAERGSAIVATGHLKWNGPAVIAASGTLTTGADAGGRVEMYAPSAPLGGSSVSHWSDTMVPSQLLEPFFTLTIHDIGLTAQALADVGWNQAGLVIGCAADCNGDGQVAINELVTAVGIALGSTPLSMCPAADTNHNGRVEVNELVAGVGAALDGCPAAPPTPTPTMSAAPTVTPTGSTPTAVGTGCPVTFQDDSLDQNLLCLYVGSYNANCGDDMLQVGFQSDGKNFSAGIANGSTIDIVLGSVTSPRTATLFGWFTDSNSNLQLLSGTATLSADGSALEIKLDSAPFQVGNCDFIDYQGAFTGTFQGSGSLQIGAERLLSSMPQRLSRP